MKLKNGGMLLLTAFIWGTAFVAQSVGMDHLGPFSFNGIRCLIGAVALLPCIWFLNRMNKDPETDCSEKEKSGKDPLEVYEQAMENIMPAVELKARRVGGATYQVPIEIRPERRQTLALRWLVMFSRKRGEKTMAERLAAEIMDAANNTGAAVKRKEEMHRMAEANKAFAHYRW